ncbi:hypothetical protein M0805_002494 [Coniferiporia weirii]|nr:hypothetical protein M0805_002494 [Coniferiporia weirii]
MQLGVVVTKDGGKLQTVSIPTPGPGEVLLKNVAVASNPKDGKVPSLTREQLKLYFDVDPGEDAAEYAFVEGNDVAGLVVGVGEGVTEYKAGDRVVAFTRMATRQNKYGAYAQFSVAPVATTFPVPGSTSFEEAATLPLAVMTAAIGLFVVLGLPEPPAPGSASLFTPDNGQGIVVYGASSSVGAYVVQLAKRAGFFVVGVAGASCDYAKTIGTDIVLDYRKYRGEGELEAALVAALSGKPCSSAYDAISIPGSSLLLSKVVARTSPNGKGRVTFILEVSDEERAQFPPGVDGFQTNVKTAYGVDERFAARFYRQISQYLIPSANNPQPFQPNRVKIIPGGLAGVVDGLKLLKEEKVNAEKLVYRVDDTPTTMTTV